MFTDAELHALNSAISNDARVLYILGLRPNANTATATSAPINYKHLITLLNTTEEKYQRGRDVNQLLEELQTVGLVLLDTNADFSESLNGEVVFLPLLNESKDSYSALHQEYVVMSLTWKPNAALLDELCQLIGVLEPGYDDTDIGDFISYWLGRPNIQYSQFQWTQKFAQALKRKRMAFDTKPMKQIGNQVVPTTSSVEVDENARKLMAKYSGNQKS